MPRKLPVAYHPAYHCPGATRMTSTRKQKEVFERARELGLVRAGEVIESPLAPVAELELAHDPDYVRAVLAGEPRDVAQSQGFDWSPELAELVRRTAGGQREACRAALEGGVAFNLASGAHHAGRATGGGFCTFNFLVTAPRALMQERKLERVLVLDLDEHQGNGTFGLVHSDRRFFCFDVSGSPFGVPPHRGPDGVYAVLEAGRALAQYRALLAELPGVVERFRPDLIEYQAGMDCWEKDPLASVPGLDAAFLAERDAFVLELARDARVPIVVNLAGGYVGEGEPRTVDLHVETLRVARRVYGCDAPA